MNPWSPGVPARSHGTLADRTGRPVQRLDGVRGVHEHRGSEAIPDKQWFQAGLRGFCLILMAKDTITISGNRFLTPGQSVP